MLPSSDAPLTSELDGARDPTPPLPVTTGSAASGSRDALKSRKWALEPLNLEERQSAFIPTQRCPFVGGEEGGKTCICHARTGSRQAAEPLVSSRQAPVPLPLCLL